MPEEEFAQFFSDSEPRLRRAFVAALGPVRGRDATAEALAYGWEHWDRVRCMDNPTGYLFRVGQSRARRWRRPPLVFPPADVPGAPWVEPGLPAALAALTEHQRVVVVLVHGFVWTHREVADLLGLSPSTVQNHLDQALAKLRAALEVRSDA